MFPYPLSLEKIITIFGYYELLYNYRERKLFVKNVGEIIEGFYIHLYFLDCIPIRLKTKKYQQHIAVR